MAAELVAALCEVRVRSGVEEAVVENVKASAAGVASLFDLYRREPTRSSEPTSGL